MFSGLCIIFPPAHRMWFPVHAEVIFGHSESEKRCSRAAGRWTVTLHSTHQRYTQSHPVRQAPRIVPSRQKRHGGPVLLESTMPTAWCRRVAMAQELCPTSSGQRCGDTGAPQPHSQPPPTWKPHQVPNAFWLGFGTITSSSLGWNCVSSDMREQMQQNLYS